MSDDADEGTTGDRPAHRPRQSGGRRDDWRDDGDDRPRPRRRSRDADLPPGEAIAAARRQVRIPALVLLAGWLVISAVDVIVLLVAIGYATDPLPKGNKSMWAWDELGQFFLWSSAVVLPVCVWGVVSCVRMLRLRGYWSAVAASGVLFVLGFPFGIVFPPLIFLPIAAFVALSQRSVQRGFRLVREGRAGGEGTAEPVAAPDGGGR